MAVVDINKNFLYNRLGQPFGRLMVRDTSPYKYKGVSIPSLILRLSLFLTKSEFHFTSLEFLDLLC